MLLSLDNFELIVTSSDIRAEGGREQLILLQEYYHIRCTHDEKLSCRRDSAHRRS